MQIRHLMLNYKIDISSCLLSDLIRYYHKKRQYEANFNHLHNAFKAGHSFWHELYLINENYLLIECNRLKKSMKYTLAKERKLNRIRSVKWLHN